MSDTPLVTRFRSGFKPGYNSIAVEGEAHFNTGIDFGIYCQTKGSRIDECDQKEVAWLLLNGEAELEFQGKKQKIKRTSLFDESPTALHLGPEMPVKILALTDVEWAVSRTTNLKSFPAQLFTPDMLKPEFRGKGLVQNTCLRNVRLIFDRTTRKDANLVLGEVVNLPGRWSSYPPHHHSQPEIYHYRFTKPQGYGHSELGEEVFKIRNNDTIKILNGLDHSQCAAPGYGMYYAWVVRHLDGNPYTGFKFTEEHEWILNSENESWLPKEFEGIL